MLLAGDIGGTNSRLALFERQPSRLRLIATADYPSSKYSGLDENDRTALLGAALLAARLAGYCYDQPPLMESI